MVGKLQKPVTTQAPRTSSPAPAPAKAPQAAAPAAKGWVPKQHTLLENVGKAVGLGLGIAVTEGLRWVPGWDKPVLDGAGKPVDAVKGATRDGGYAIRKRHEEVVGPQIAAKAETIKAGPLHDLLAGMGEGATEAPGASYRLDAQLDHALHPNKK